MSCYPANPISLTINLSSQTCSSQNIITTIKTKTLNASSSLLEANQQQHQDQRALHGNDRDKLLKYAPADNKLKKN
jgi:hypothetical protein